MKEKRKNIGIISTVIFHLLILLLLVFSGFKTFFPLPDEEGILVNFGDGNVGTGKIEPSFSSYRAEIIQTATPPSTSISNNKEELMTQDFEDAAAIEEKKQQQQKKQQEDLEIERKRQEEIERQRKEEQQRIDQTQQTTKNAFVGASQNKNNSQGEGTGNGPGNQGDLRGDPNSSNRGTGQGQGTSGQGLGKEGISFNLKGRTAQQLPKPNYPSNEDGDVVITVRVNQDGNVISAEFRAQGSTTTNRSLVNAALDAAKKAKFSKDINADLQQVGTITYRFIRN
jgi:TonB family protein